MAEKPMCVCGHKGPDHNQWWDVDEGCGMGCDLCDCSDVEFPRG